MAQKIPFETRYQKSKQDGISFTDPSLTEQHHLNDADINEIVNKYTKTQLIANYEAKNIPELYGHFGEFDYSDAMDKMSKIKEDFESLPSAERLKYENDPSFWYNTQVKQMLTDAMKTEPEIAPVGIEAVADVSKTEEKTPTEVGGA